MYSTLYRALKSYLRGHGCCVPKSSTFHNFLLFNFAVQLLRWRLLDILPLIMFVGEKNQEQRGGQKIASVVSSMASVASHRPVAAASPKAKGTPKRLPSQRAPPRMSSSIARPKPPKSEDLAEELRHPAANLSSSGTGLGIETAATTTPEDGSEASEAAAPIPPPPPPKSCLKHTDLTTALLSAMAPAKSVVWGDLPRGEGAHSKWSEGGRRWIKAKYVQKLSLIHI